MVRRWLEDGRSKKNIYLLLAKVAKLSKLSVAISIVKDIIFVDPNNNFTRHRLYALDRAGSTADGWSRGVNPFGLSFATRQWNELLKQLTIRAVLKNRKEIYKIWIYVYKLPPLPDRARQRSKTTPPPSLRYITHIYILYVRGRCARTRTHTRERTTAGAGGNAYHT